MASIRQNPAQFAQVDLSKYDDYEDSNSSHVERISAPSSPVNKTVQGERVSTQGSNAHRLQLKKWFIGSIDQGTTSSRFLIFNGEGMPVASHQIEFENMYPESG